MDPKLVAIYVLVGTVICLSHLGSATLAELRFKLNAWRCRNDELPRRKS